MAALAVDQPRNARVDLFNYRRSLSPKFRSFDAYGCRQKVRDGFKRRTSGDSQELNDLGRLHSADAFRDVGGDTRSTSEDLIGPRAGGSTGSVSGGKRNDPPCEFDGREIFGVARELFEVLRCCVSLV